MNENLKQYYEYLKSANADVPDTYESFAETLADENNAKQYYDYLKSNSFDTPDSYESFTETLGLKKKVSPIELASRGKTVLDEYAPQEEKPLAPSQESGEVQSPSNLKTPDLSLQTPQDGFKEVTPETLGLDYLQGKEIPRAENLAKTFGEYANAAGGVFNQKLQDMVDAVDWVHTTATDAVNQLLFGKEASNEIKILRDEGISLNPAQPKRPFEALSEGLDLVRRHGGAKPLPKNVIGGIVEGTAGVVPDILATVFVPEIKAGQLLSKAGVKSLSKFGIVLGTEQAIAGSQQAESVPEMITAPIVGAFEGYMNGWMFDNLGAMSSKIGGKIADKMIPEVQTVHKAVDKALVQHTSTSLTNAVFFGTYGNLEEYLTTGKISPETFATNAGMGLALGVRETGKLLWAKGLTSLASAPRSAVKNITDSNVKPEDLAKQAKEKIDLVESGQSQDREGDLVMAFMLAKQSQLKAVADEVKSNPDEVKKSIEESTLEDKAKELLIDKVNEVVADNDTKIAEAKKYTDDIALLDDALGRIRDNKEWDDTRKEIESEPLKRKKEELKKKVLEVYGKAEPEPKKEGEGEKEKPLTKEEKEKVDAVLNKDKEDASRKETEDTRLVEGGISEQEQGGTTVNSIRNNGETGVEAQEVEELKPIIDYIKTLNEYESDGYDVERLRIAKEEMLADPQRTKIAMEIRDFARKIWGNIFSEKTPLAELRMFFYGDSNSVDEFAQNQIKGQEQEIKSRQSEIDGLNSKKKLSASDKSFIKFDEDKISSAEKEIEKIKSALSEWRQEKKAYQPQVTPKNAEISSETRQNDIVNEVIPPEQGKVSSETIPPESTSPNKATGEKPQKKVMEIGRKAVEDSTLPDDVKQELLTKGIEYVPRGRKFTDPEAEQVVKLFDGVEGGLDKLAAMVRDLTNGIMPDTRTYLNTIVAERYATQLEGVTDFAERQAIRDKLADAVIFGAEQGKLGGQLVEAQKRWGRVLGSTPELIAASVREKLDRENREFFADKKLDTKTIQTVIDEFLKSADFKKRVEEEVAGEIDKIGTKNWGKESKKKIDDFFNSLLIDPKQQNLYGGLLGIPVAMYNGSILAVKNALLLGVDLATAIQRGAEWLDKEYKDKYAKGLVDSPDWNKDEYIADTKERLRGLTVKPKRNPKQRKSEIDIAIRSAEKSIKSLESQIKQIKETGDVTPKEKKPTPSNPKLDELIKRRDELKAEKKKLLDEQKPPKPAKEPKPQKTELEKQIESTQKTIDNLERQIYELKIGGELPTPKSKKEIISEELTNLRNKVSELREERKALQKKVTIPPSQKELVDKLFEKMAKLATRKQVANFVMDYLQEMASKGMVSDPRMRAILAKALGRNYVTEQTEAKITEAARAIGHANKMTEDFAKRFDEYLAEFETNPNSPRLTDMKEQITRARKLAHKAQFKAQQANQMINEVLEGTPDLVSRVSTLIKGNLLVPSSQIANIAGNIMLLPVTGPSYLISGLADIGMSNMIRVAERLKKVDPQKHPDLYHMAQSLPSSERTIYPIAYAKGYFSGFGKGIVEGVKQLKTGTLSSDITKAEVQRGIHPIEAFKHIINTISGKEKARVSELAGDALEALPAGWVGEAMFRLLNMGDKPFRMGAERGRLSEIFKTTWNRKIREAKAIQDPVERQKRLDYLNKAESVERQRFLEHPDSESMTEGRKQGDIATFSENTALSNWISSVDRLFQNKKDNTTSTIASNAIRLLKSVTLPYVKVPINLTMLSIELSCPPIQAAKMFYHINKGNNRAAMDDLGKMAIGSILTGAVVTLVSNGLITFMSDDKDVKAAQQSVGKEEGRINLTGIRRLIRGEDPAWQEGDRLYSLKRLGIVSVQMMSIAQAYNDKTPEEQKAFKEKGGLEQIFNSSVMMLPHAPGMALQQSVMVGANTLLQGILGGEAEKDKWITSQAKVLSSVLYPNTVATISQAYDPERFYRETRDLSKEEGRIKKHLVNIFKERTFMSDKLPPKVTLWGEPVLRTPQGEDPLMYNVLGITKKKEYQKYSFGTRMYETYEQLSEQYGEEEARKIFPSMPSPATKVGWDDSKMSPDELAQYQMRVGQIRAQDTEAYLNSKEWADATLDEKVQELTGIYLGARKEAEAEMFSWMGLKERDPQAWKILLDNEALPMPKMSKKLGDKTMTPQEIEQLNDTALSFYVQEAIPFLTQNSKETLDEIRSYKDEKTGISEYVQELNRIWKNSLESARSIMESVVGESE